MATADNPSTASKSPRAVFATAPAWLPVAIVLLVFAQVVSHDWVDFDDPGHVAENPLLTPVTVEHLAAFWRAPYFHLYIPASYTLLAAEAAASRWLAGDALAFYATKLVAPWNLCVAYGRMPRFVIDLPHTPAVAAAAALALAAVFLLPRLAAWRLPTLLFVVALLPVLGFVPFVFQNQSTVADRYASLALLGPALGVTGLVAAVTRRPAWRGFLAVGTAITIAGLAAISWQQAATWRDTRTLAIQACRASPGLTVPWTLLSGWQLDHGEVEAAVATAERAATLAPGNAIAWLNLGAGLVRLHEFEAANAAFARDLP